MALEYRDSIKFEKLAPVLEEYAEWFGNICFNVAYHGGDAAFEKVVTPSSFYDWQKEAESAEGFNLRVVNEIDTVHADMLRIGADVLMRLGDNKKPDADTFKEFKNLYSSFLSRIRRLEKDSALEGSGIDEKTGLRQAKTIKADLKKEMERLSRQGNPFALVATRVDKFAGQPNQDHSLKVAVANIKRCVRSFDDAYYLGNGHFILSLKHADIIGAQACVNRLQIFLRDDEKNNPPLTMSYCMVEPVPGDEVDNLLKNMNQDLADHMNESDAVLKFIEVSEIERFANKSQ